MKIQVEGREISIKAVDQEDYISLTDIARKKGTSRPDEVIRSWLRNANTIPYLEAWEKMNNPNFKRDQMDAFKLETIDNRDVITVGRYIEMTQTIGIISTRGRYGGTYAHRQIAFEFAGWIEPVFRLYITTEFERLKSEEAKRLNTEWNYSRFLSKVNYSLHTESIKKNIIPRLGKGDKPHVFSSEADLLNMAVFGMTAKEFREQFPGSKGNLRDVASIQQLSVLANMESMNSYLIEAGASQEARFTAIYKEAQRQLEVFSEDPRLIE